MAYTRSLLKTLASWIIRIVAAFVLLSPDVSWAAFASQFSLGIGEQYNDNIFFSKPKEHDFITSFLPTLSFFYAPSGDAEPTGRLAITPIGEVYARNSALNNFGENVSINSSYLYRYSPRLYFDFSDTFSRQGSTRTGGSDNLFVLQTGPTTSVPGSTAGNLKDLLSGGDQITNSLSLQGAYLFRPDVSITSSYSNSYSKFSTAGGTDVFHTIGARGIYNWRRDHNLHAGYSLSISNARNGENEVIHNFDFGDDYFSNYNLQLTPTLSLTASTGLSFATGGNQSPGTDNSRKGSGPTLASNTNITLTKLWPTAVLNAGFRKGLTPSFGVSGISDTISVFTNFTSRFTEKLSTNADAIWSSYDTEDVNFKTFQAGIGFQYTITSWLSTALNYRFKWIDGGSGATQTDLVNRGTVNSNTISLVLTSHFDLWPNTGLARGLNSATLSPILKTPFPSP